MRANMKSSVSLTPKIVGSPIKVNQVIYLPHTKKGGSQAKVEANQCLPQNKKWCTHIL